jgi:hypothetical protein
MVWLAMMWLCTQRRSPWPAGAMPRERLPAWGFGVSFAFGARTGTVGGAGAEAAAATAASVLAYRAPPPAPPSIDWAPLLLPKTKRLLSSGSGRSVFIVGCRSSVVGCRCFSVLLVDWPEIGAGVGQIGRL